MKAKKSLGQNFLKSKSALAAMVSAGTVEKGDTILEIGPGKGALTEVLLATGATVVAVEKDRELVDYLSEKFAEEIKSKKLQLVEDDILKFDPSRLKKFKVIANIPYYITGMIIRTFLGGLHQPDTMVLLVQKEVAERIVARDHKESLLSLSVKAYGAPKLITKVPARYFSPAPKVDSAIIAITAISKKNFKKISEETFFTLLHAGFAHKRKMLAGNLRTSGYKSEDILAVFAELGIDEKVRPEELPIEKWFLLAERLSIHTTL